MLFSRLKFSGILSFGPEGIDLPMKPLNVLIGPNGSGKSNFLDVISLFQAAPRGIKGPISRRGGMREWLWKGPNAPKVVALEAAISQSASVTIRHFVTLRESIGGGVHVPDEQLELLGDTTYRGAKLYCRPPADEQVAMEMERSGEVLWYADSSNMVVTKGDAVHFSKYFNPGESLISDAGGPEQLWLWSLRERYKKICLYRHWSLGPDTKLRIPCDAHLPSDFLQEDHGNLPIVLSQLSGIYKRALVDALKELFDGIVDVRCAVTAGTVALFLEEAGSRSIPATRLSDGTLRYLCLLAILLHPDPPPLICIEEPELGLHPDVLPMLCDLMVDASSRSQIVVTTHSDVLVDALTDRPESVVVCEKHDGQTEMRRLDRAELSKWLKDYRLGDLWTSGELGGNRW